MLMMRDSNRARREGGRSRIKPLRTIRSGVKVSIASPRSRAQASRFMPFSKPRTKVGIPRWWACWRPAASWSDPTATTSAAMPEFGKECRRASRFVPEPEMSTRIRERTPQPYRRVEERERASPPERKPNNTPVKTSVPHHNAIVAGSGPT